MNELFNIAGKVATVTGGSGVLGSNISRSLLEAGVKVFIIGGHQENVDKVLEKVRKKYAKQPVNTIDGVKIEFNKEWVHLRKSNTEPIIRIYTESTSEITADNIAKKIMMDIRELMKMQ